MSCPLAFSSRRGATSVLTGHASWMGQAAQEGELLLVQKRLQTALKKLPRNEAPLNSSSSSGVTAWTVNSRCVVINFKLSKQAEMVIGSRCLPGEVA